VWQSLREQRSGVRRREGFAGIDAPWALAAPVDDFEGKDFVQPRKSLKVMCQQIQMGYAAASLALADAALTAGSAPPQRVGTVFGGEAFYANPADLTDVFRQVVTLGNDTRAWGEVAMREIEPLWMLKYLPNMVASHVSILLDAQGPSNTIVLGDNSSLPAIIEGVELLRRSWADVVVVGATGSQLVPTAVVYRDRTRLCPGHGEPAQAVRPFDARRQGTVCGEGAAALVIETRAHAVARGARIQAEILAGDRAFAPSPAQLPARLARSIQDTLQQAGVAAADVGHINANGTGVVDEDRLEAEGLAQILPNCPVFAPKSYFGNLGPATGACELICSLLALQHRELPATLNYQVADPACPVHVASHSQPLRQPLALAVNQNPTGQIATLLIHGPT
jgi:3-oxoacyl-[acyl-carrier-protein] synthase II